MEMQIRTDSMVIDLKMEDFRPEFAGKMSFYLSAVDDLLRHPQDAPSIGLILCQGKNQTVVEYALRDTASPSAFRNTASPGSCREPSRRRFLPSKIWKKSLPSSAARWRRCPQRNS